MFRSSVGFLVVHPESTRSPARMLLARWATPLALFERPDAVSGRQVDVVGDVRVTDLHAALESALGPIFHVEREVRPVGNCRLFVASNLDDGTELLVKVLPSTLSLAVDDQVFERELLLLGDRLTDVRLVTPRVAGRAAASVYHARRFVSGTTLRNWITRNGDLPMRKAVDVLRDVLSALSQAHAAGVGHGDLKPENVLLGEREASVADTGVVGAVERSLNGAPPGVAVAALCAPPYVAPERREGTASGPTSPVEDMYSVGVIAHEMLASRPPAPESEPLEEIRTVPAWLGELVRRCLAPRQADRWPDAREALSTIPHPSGA